MRYRIVNWATYQHYAQRCPPWIKLHNDLLTSRTWVTLDDASRVLAIASMLLASRDKAGSGTFDGSPEYVQRVAYLNAAPDFEPLIAVGFLEPADTTKPETDSDKRRGEAEARARESACKMLASASRAETDSTTAALPIITPDDGADIAYKVLRDLRPEYRTLSLAAFKAAWQNESDHSHRARGFNDAIRALVGKIDADKDPLRLVGAYIRNARKMAQANGAVRDVMAGD